MLVMVCLMVCGLIYVNKPHKTFREEVKDTKIKYIYSRLTFVYLFFLLFISEKLPAKLQAV